MWDLTFTARKVEPQPDTFGKYQGIQSGCSWGLVHKDFIEILDSIYFPLWKTSHCLRKWLLVFMKNCQLYVAMC